MTNLDMPRAPPARILRLCSHLHWRSVHPSNRSGVSPTAIRNRSEISHPAWAARKIPLPQTEMDRPPAYRLALNICSLACPGQNMGPLREMPFSAASRCSSRAERCRGD